MPLVVDWTSNIIQVTSPTTDVDGQTLHDFIEDNMASARGSTVEDIIQPEGKIEDPSNPGVYSQIIIIVNSPWQIQFWQGSGYTRLYGAKVVGGLADEPFKATGTAGDITVLESPVDGVTVATSTSVLTPEDITAITASVWNAILANYLTPGSTGAKLNEDASITEQDKTDIADKVWDENIADHLTPGSTGEKVDSQENITIQDKKDIADEVWDKELP